MKIVAALVIALVGTGTAQAQIGMTCQTTISGRTECKETAGAQAERLNREHMDRMRAQSATGRSEFSASLASMRQRNLEAKVAKAVKAGRCDEAKQIALDGGSLDMAEQAMRICTPAT